MNKIHEYKNKIPFIRKNEEPLPSLQSLAYQNPSNLIQHLINPKARQLSIYANNCANTNNHVTNNNHNNNSKKNNKSINKNQLHQYDFSKFPSLKYTQEEISLALNHTYQQLFLYYQKNNNILAEAKRVILYKLKDQSIKSHHLRKKIWMMVSGSLEKRNKNQNFYKKILSYPQYPDFYKKIIKADVVRTIPSKQDIQLQNTLQNLLIAYARRNPAIGYCQGMNFITNFLVTMQFSNQQTFWLMTSIFQDIIPMEYYTNMMAVAVDLKIIKQIVRYKFPKLHDKIQNLNIDISIFMLEWLVCLFTTALPFTLSVIVWDFLFTQGSVVLIKTSLIILQFYSSIILQSQDFSDFLMKMQQKKKKIVINQIQFMDKLFYTFIDPHILELLRNVYSFQMSHEKMQQQIQNQINPKYKKQKEKWKEFQCDLSWPICFQSMKKAKSNSIQTDFWVIRSAVPPKVINKYLEQSQRKRRQSVHLNQNFDQTDTKIYKQLSIGRIQHICYNNNNKQNLNKIKPEGVQMDQFQFGFRRNIRNLSSLVRGKKIMDKLKEEQQKNFSKILSQTITIGLNSQNSQQQYKFNT